MVTQTTTAKKYIRIVSVIDEYDLRMVTSQKTYLEGVARAHKLQHLESVLYTNRSMTRFRMVLRIFDTVFTCAPWIDKTEQHSLYLKISEQLSLMAGLDCRVKIDEISTMAVERREAINARIRGAIKRNKKKLKIAS